MKRIHSASKRISLLYWTFLIVFTVLFPTEVNAESMIEQIEGGFYEFDEKSKYEISDSTPTRSVVPIGRLNVSGEIHKLDDDNFTRYDVSKGNIIVSYSLDSTMLNSPEDEWHMYEDNTKNIDGIDLDDKIKNGAIIVQTSLDMKRWTTDMVMTNAFTDEYDGTTELYSTKEIQLVNGCYYRIIIAYEQEIVTGTSQILLFQKEQKEYRKRAEVYVFYAENSTEKELSNANSTPRKELGEKICVKKDSGYSQQTSIDNKNPHYGWDVGTFSVNGYTRETSLDGKPLFLKNAGDKVTLWFRLTKEIDDLIGDGKYRIVEDKNGSDQYFEVPKTNFKHGVLIIRFTDFEGVKHEPIIYTDFLAANATTGADTKAVLFEEGDYEVALNYTIGENGVFGAEFDYRIFFEFSIRNGNTMFFPFDVITGAELRDNAITPNGFMIDMAKSRYLNINVTRTAIVQGINGHSEDVRFNGPAKDGAKYVDDGVYMVDVTNQYTDEHTVKTFYVGTDPFMIAMARSGKTPKELDDFISQGYTINADGSLVPQSEEIPDDENVDDDERDETSNPSTIKEETMPSGQNSLSTDMDEKNNSPTLEKNNSKSAAGTLVIGLIVVCSLVFVGSILGIKIIKKNKKRNGLPEINIDNKTEKGDDN